MRSTGQVLNDLHINKTLLLEFCVLKRRKRQRKKLLNEIRFVLDDSNIEKAPQFSFCHQLSHVDVRCFE